MKRLLLLHRNEERRSSITSLLSLAGYELVSFSKGYQGVEAAKQRQPDLVLCATELSDVDGYGVLHLFRCTASLAATPFILIGPTATWADTRRAMDAGADDYLAMPIVAGELLQAIAGRLHRFPLLPAEPIATGYDEASVAGSLASLITDRTPHIVARRHSVYREGEDPKQLYFIQSGRIKAVKTTSFGKELITSFYQTGEFFGYKDLLEQTCYHESAVAIEDCVLLHIPAADFLQLVRLPEVSQQFVRLLAGRKRAREQQLLDMAYQSLRRRVANALLALHNQGETNEATPFIRVAREDLAALVGIAPESLSRTLSEFRHDGLLEVSSQGIRLLQPEYMRQAEW
ncbi:cyclic nucleotide-binding domain-containing protein [Hymenobacter aerilatus]|uniref:Cyclic nucleotide-binding domain-containing protein n=1 Tax=Hymenobacter aerilatus TaxID=2932251 RepID=A0A8T9SSX9_9BACT|nr:cyclic nucleotide-binding domain-containing protein [Hymenobacter aerilatus]UOR04915.1 cyclic nucleotide-binding domain-containing protein [Hymenobacter aerilatus]